MKTPISALAVAALSAALAHPAQAADAISPTTQDPFSTGDRGRSEESRRMDDLSLEELLNVVTASKKGESLSDAPAIISVIHREEIEAYGAQNLAEVLDRATGTLARMNSLFPYNALSVRGDGVSPTGNHVLVLLNGRPFRDSNSLGFSYPMYVAFPVANIERVEFIRGPGSVLYGTSAYSGVVNVITRSPRDTEAVAAFQYGSFNTRDANAYLGTAVGDLKATLSVKSLESSGWPYTAFDSPPTNFAARPPRPARASLQETVNMGMHTLGLVGTAEYRGLTLSTFYSKTSQDSLGNQPIWPANPFRGERLFADAGYSHKLGKDWTWNVNLTHNNMRTDLILDPAPRALFSPGNTAVSRAVSRDLLAETSVSGSPLRNLNVVAGAVMDYQNGRYASSGALPAPNLGVEYVTYSTLPYDRVWWSGYAQADYRLFSMLKLVAGGQIVKPDAVSAQFVPRLGAILNLSDEWGVKVLYGEAFRAAAAKETQANIPGAIVGNPGLDPEFVHTLDAQVFYTSRLYSLSATYFQSIEMNLVGATNAPVGVTFVNSNSHVFFRGVELEGRARLWQGLDATGSYSFQQSQDVNGNAASYMPNHVAKAGLTYQASPGVSIALFDVYYSNFVSTPSQQAALQVNPRATNGNLLSATVTTNVLKLMNVSKPYRVLASAHATNLFDSGMSQPETGVVNSLPARAPRAFYGQLRFEY